MIKSMTGFAKAEVNEQGIAVSVEMKTLNGRGLELNMKAPRYLSAREVEVKELIKTIVDRGSIQLYVNVDKTEGAAEFALNISAASAIYEALNELKKELKMKDAVKLEHLLQFSNQFSTKQEGEDEELIWKMLQDALKQALNSLNEMRLKEGSNIARDMSKRMKNIHDIVKKIEIMGIDRIPIEREKMRQRIATLFENDEIDEQRLQMEFVIMADKLDISEECVRLHSHIKMFFDTMKQKEPQGRKLNFLLQELHREINTIGSKISDSNVAHLVVTVKEELERIREQVQNVE